MMSSDLLNILTKEDLRNYAKHQYHLIECFENLLYSKNELIEALQKCYNEAMFVDSWQREYTKRSVGLQHIDDELFQKYCDELPHLITACEKVNNTDGAKKEKEE